MVDLLFSGPEDATHLVLLAHGAGASMTSPFMEKVANLLAKHDIATARFEFAYMAARRRGNGTRRPPPRAETLIPEYEAAANAVLARRSAAALLIGGKSLGGRVASMLADALYSKGRICGLICLSYPFHPPGKPESLRTVHLSTLRCPALIVQGERDPFGSRAEVQHYSLSPAIRLHWVGDGDHDWRPRRNSGFTHDGNVAAAIAAIASFVRGLV